MGEQMALSTAAWFVCALGHIDEAIPVLQHAIATLRHVNTYGIGGASNSWLTRARCAAIARRRLPWQSRDSVSTTHANGCFAGSIYSAASRATARIRDRCCQVDRIFDVEVQRTKRLVPPFITDTRDRVMMLVQAARGTAIAQQSAAAGARLTEEQAIELMFAGALPIPQAAH